jgi:protocatechuate 3,4-dioxygenase beta subunit
MRFLCLFPIFALVVLQTPDAATIGGRVTDRATDAPLPAVTLLLMREGVPPLRTTSDSEGRFSIPAIPPGQYRLVTSREGYAPARAIGRQGYGRGLPVTVGVGDRRTGLTIRLDKAGAITGTILDEAGSPVFHAEIAAVGTYFDEFGQRGLRPPENAAVQTDDRGQFRIYGLEAGHYYVRITGPSDIFRAPAYMFYYSGGTTGPANVVVESGGEAALGTIPAPQPKVVPARLRIVAEEPVPVGTRRQLQFGLQGMPLPTISSSVARFGGPDTINIEGLPVGTNEIQASWESVGGVVRGRTTLEVRATDSEVLGEITMSKGVTVVVRGSVDVGNGVRRAVPNLRISLTAMASSPGATSMYRFVGTTAKDGIVTWKSVPPRDYWVAAGELPENAYIAAFTSAAGDLLGGKIAIERDSQLEISVKENGGTLFGTVVEQNGNAAHGSLVAFVPEDKSLRHRFWLSAGTASDHQGKFVFRGVTPGRYKMFAWANAPGPGPFRNSEFLARYEDAALSVEVGIGERREIQLQLADENE